MPKTVFQESAAKVVIGFFSKIKLFENMAFGHVTEVPTTRYIRCITEMRARFKYYLLNEHPFLEKREVLIKHFTPKRRR